MIEMTLSSRHRIRNLSPGGLRSSTLPLGHGGSPQYWLSHVDGEETFVVSFKPTGNRTPNSGVKGSGANHYPKAAALDVRLEDHLKLFLYNTSHRFLVSVCINMPLESTARWQISTTNQIKFKIWWCREIFVEGLMFLRLLNDALKIFY